MFSSLVVIVIVIVLGVVDVILAADVATFTPIELDFDDSKISTVLILLSIYGGSGPNTTMFTIFPSNEGDGITIETSPANLVSIWQDWNTLVFEWNTDVSSTATSGGVRIGIPSHQLEEIEVDDGHTAQVFGGFTNIRELRVGDDGSILRASMMSLVSDRLYLVNSGGRMYVETNIPVNGTSSSVTVGGQTWIETPSFNNIFVGNEGSQLNIKGDVDLRGTYAGSVWDGAELTVTGTITGTIEIGNNSTVNAPSCDNVTSSNGVSQSGNGTCNAGPQIVDVDVCDLSQQSPDFGGAVSVSSSVLPGYFATIAVVVVVTVVTVATTATLI